MATNIRIIHARDFIRATPEGALDREQSAQLLRAVATAASSQVDHEIILDTRHAQLDLSITDLWYLAQDLAALGKGFSRKTAVLCPLEKFDLAGFFALCAQNRGLPVKAFTSFEEAFEWLVADRP
ncbi:MAG: hypothetical protein ACLQDL_01025 [Spirochaetia bacterium]